MTTTPDTEPKVGRLERRLLISRISIQSKLLVMLLLTSIVSVAIVGFIGYTSGRDSLRESVFERLTEIQTSQDRQLRSQFADLTNSLLVYSKGETTMQALQDFTSGFNELAGTPVGPPQQQQLEDFYNNVFAPAKEAQTGTKLDISALVPTGNAQRYLQGLYTAPFTEPAAALANDDAGDGSAWSTANARFNNFFREIVQRFSYEDALLIDDRGIVVYSAYKGVDLGTNILTGPYRGGDLTTAYTKAMESNAVDYIGVTDFSDYQPADEPTAWLVSPVRGADRAAGVLALQFPISRINALMTVNQHWETAGMGRTGETILVGPDELMRSDSRLFLEDPEQYVADVVAAGTSPDIAEAAIRQDGTTLVQSVATEATNLALQGQTGTTIDRDYLGNETLQAYAPVNLPGLSWAIVAKINTEEAFAPVSAFTRTLVLSTVAIILGVSLAAMVLSRLFVRPLRRLEAGAHRISAGNYGISLPVHTRDEFGDLTTAFNEMSRNLSIKEELLVEQRKENDRLLLALMPEPVAQRYRDGEETIAQDHQDVTVLFADIAGLDALSTQLSAEESLSIVNRLIRQFDSAADNLGVEKVRTLHNGYLASCGLNVPRLDNVRRTVDFALEMQLIVDRFAGETGHRLSLRAGIDTGTVTSGLIGRTSLAYDMWGAAVNVAFHVQSGSPQPGIYVTSGVHDVMRDSRGFTAAGAVTVDGTEESIWRLTDTR